MIYILTILIQYLIMMFEVLNLDGPLLLVIYLLFVC